MNRQVVDLTQPLHSHRLGRPPLVLRAIVSVDALVVAGGVPQSSTRQETYVLLSSLPVELQERVKLAVQAAVTGV